MGQQGVSTVAARLCLQQGRRSRTPPQAAGAYHQGLNGQLEQVAAVLVLAVVLQAQQRRSGASQHAGGSLQGWKGWAKEGVQAGAGKWVLASIEDFAPQA